MMQNKSSTPKVTVVGRNYCNILTMSRAFGEAGYEVEVLHLYKRKPSRIRLFQGMKPEKHSKYVTRFSEYVVNQDEETVIQYLLQLAGDSKRNLLVPVDDYTVSIVDHYLEQLGTFYIVPNIANKQGEIIRLMNKYEQKKLAKAFNLSTLDSVIIESNQRNFQIPKDVKYPCFVKPAVSMNSTKAKMNRCDSEQELNQLLSDYVKNGDFQVLVEDFAEIKSEYSLLGVCTKDGVIAPALFKACVGGHRERKGVAVMGEIVDASAYQNVINQCMEYMKALKYTGIFDIDLIEAKDGNLYFIEVNFRAGASTYAFVKAGVNLPGILADNLLKGVELNQTYRAGLIGTKFVSEKVLLEEYARNDVSLELVKEYMAKANIHFIKDEHDFKPYHNFRRYFGYATLLRLFYRIKDNNKEKRRI